MKSLFILALGLLLTSAVFAQDFKSMLAKELKAANFENASELLGFNLDPSSAAGQVFGEMTDAFMANGASKLELVKKYSDNVQNLNPDLAKSLTKDFLKIEKDRIKLMSKMSKKMGKFLSPENTLALLQYQNKKNALMDGALARLVPFANQ